MFFLKYLEIICKNWHPKCEYGWEVLTEPGIFICSAAIKLFGPWYFRHNQLQLRNDINISVHSAPSDGRKNGDSSDRRLNALVKGKSQILPFWRKMLVAVCLLWKLPYTLCRYGWEQIWLVFYPYTSLLIIFIPFRLPQNYCAFENLFISPAPYEMMYITGIH